MREPNPEILTYDIGRATTDADLEQILAIQTANLREVVGTDERREQGFVTLKHDLSLLREMCLPHAHVVARLRASDEIVAYALVMMNECRSRLPLLEPMFVRLERVSWRGRAIADLQTYFMGQVCVAKAHRGQELVDRMYAEHRRLMAPHFDLMITEIDRANPRSVRAHEKAGFEVIDAYTGDDGREWVVVSLEL